MDKAAITPLVVSRLIAAQFAQWAHLPVTPVELTGTTTRHGPWHDCARHREIGKALASCPYGEPERARREPREAPISKRHRAVHTLRKCGVVGPGSAHDLPADGPAHESSAVTHEAVAAVWRASPCAGKTA
jgi:hypothetical protein